MILFPPAKVNLGLFITGKRPDGYHDIESCMYPIPVHDVLEIIPSEEFEFITSGLKVEGQVQDNICVKAFQLMQEKFNVGNCYMHLQKNIPMGAGLGGGSADAAYVLKAINELFSLKIDNNELRSLASLLGSDCPFFISSSAQIASGRGELLSPVNVDLSGYFMKIINPGIHIGTKEAYSNVHLSDKSFDWESISSLQFDDWKKHLKNDFEKSVIKLHPVLETIKKKLYEEGALYASMSGSGSTIYGIYDKEPAAFGTYPFEKILAL